MRANLFVYFAIFHLAFSTEKVGKFEIDYGKNSFLLNGQPFRYISGTIHYFQVPRMFWKDRMMKLKAMGANAVQTYINWFTHEKFEGKYIFSGEADIVKYIETAEQVGLKVILRPGPYIDAEQDFGGLPAWLLKVPDIKYRTSDPKFLAPVKRFFDVVLPKLKQLLITNGGPIIMVQVENEYGSWHTCDRNYTTWLRDLLKQHFGEGIVYFSTDGCFESYLQCTIPEVYATVDFGVSSLEDVKRYFAAQRNHTKGHGGPAVNSEFYPGWFTQWGGPYNKVDIQSVISSMEYMYKEGASFNVYPFHGGTNFGYNAGAEQQQPNKFFTVTTSYDFNAPLTEAGDYTPKYFAMRQTIERLTGKPIKTRPPRLAEKFFYGNIIFRKVGSIFDVLTQITVGNPIQSKYPLSAENLDHYYGFVLYETVLDDGFLLNVTNINDRLYIFFNDKLVAVFQRGSNTTIKINSSQNDVLRILVENQGRVCYGPFLSDSKGIFGNITLDDKIVTNWKAYRLNFQRLLNSSAVGHHIFEKTKGRKYEEQKTMIKQTHRFIPSVYVSEFVAHPRAGETYFNSAGWGKGQLWTGQGFNLGRYWPMAGPQITLYHPFVTVDRNKLLLFELEQPGQCRKVDDFCMASLINYPIWSN